MRLSLVYVAVIDITIAHIFQGVILRGKALFFLGGL